MNSFEIYMDMIAFREEGDAMRLVSGDSDTENFENYKRYIQPINEEFLIEDLFIPADMGSECSSCKRDCKSILPINECSCYMN